MPGPIWGNLHSKKENETSRKRSKYKTEKSEEKKKRKEKPEATWEKKGKDLGGEKKNILKGFLTYLETKTEENRITNKLFVSI